MRTGDRRCLRAVGRNLLVFGAFRLIETLPTGGLVLRLVVLILLDDRLRLDDGRGDRRGRGALADLRRGRQRGLRRRLGSSVNDLGDRLTRRDVDDVLGLVAAVEAGDDVREHGADALAQRAVPQHVRRVCLVVRTVREPRLDGVLPRERVAELGAALALRGVGRAFRRHLDDAQVLADLRLEDHRGHEVRAQRDLALDDVNVPEALHRAQAELAALRHDQKRLLRRVDTARRQARRDEDLCHAEGFVEVRRLVCEGVDALDGRLIAGGDGALRCGRRERAVLELLFGFNGHVGLLCGEVPRCAARRGGVRQADSAYRIASSRMSR